MAKESDDVRAPLERELADAKASRDELAARWSREKEMLDRVKELTRSIDELTARGRSAPSGSAIFSASPRFGTGSSPSSKRS